MASATEQLATQFNWSAFGKAKDLKARILFTLGALIVYRIGTHIPLPGVDARILADVNPRIRPKASWACSTCSRAVRCSAWRFSH